MTQAQQTRPALRSYFLVVRLGRGPADNVSSMTVYGCPSREDFIDSLAQTVVRVYISRRKVEILQLQSEIADPESTIS